MTSHNVTIKNFAFSPEEISIAEGDTVIWTSEDNAPHTVTADDGTFDSGEIVKDGPPFEHTFDSAGPDPVRYHCEFHDHMKGKVIVTASKPGY